MNFAIFIAAADMPGVGMTTLFGMGTVFVCLTIIYFIMMAMSRLLGRERDNGAQSSPGFEATGEEVGDMGMPARDELCLENTVAPPVDTQMAAAIAVALRKNRLGKSAPARAPETGGMNPWKFAGRMRGLRK